MKKEMSKEELKRAFEDVKGLQQKEKELLKAYNDIQLFFIEEIKKSMANKDTTSMFSAKKDIIQKHIEGNRVAEETRVVQTKGRELLESITGFLHEKLMDPNGVDNEFFEISEAEMTEVTANESDINQLLKEGNDLLDESNALLQEFGAANGIEIPCA